MSKENAGEYEKDSNCVNWVDNWSVFWVSFDCTRISWVSILVYMNNNEIFGNCAQKTTRTESLFEAPGYANGCHRQEIIPCGCAVLLCYTLFEYWSIGWVFGPVNSHFPYFSVGWIRFGLFWTDSKVRMMCYIKWWSIAIMNDFGDDQRWKIILLPWTFNRL